MSFFDKISNPEGDAGEAHTDEEAIQALAALSATKTKPPRRASASYKENDDGVGHDSSQLLQPPEATMDTAATFQHLQDNREPAYTRQEPTTSQIRQAPQSQAPQSQAPESQTPKPDMAHSHITSLKQEHTSRTQSPLRESSVPVPSTETPSTATSTAPAPRKRPPPKSSAKKGTASTIKKDSSKKRKLESSSKSKSKSSVTKRVGSTSATPVATSPGPRSVRTASSPPRSSPSAGVEEGDNASEDEEDEDEVTPDPDAELYCLCRRPDTGTFMIGCDGGCDDWFHGKCVNITERDKGLIDRYICPRCEEKEIGLTTWKRMCRRHACRLPARVKAKEGSSKYCSDECGLLFFKGLLASTRSSGNPSSPGSKKAKKPTQNNQDLGPRGGVISAGELKTLLASAPTIDEFRRLGEGILSPPATPPGQKQSHQSNGLNDIELERLIQITDTKETTRNRHALLKDRTKFINILKQSAARLAEDRTLKPKDMCGFDERVTWTDSQFAAWRESPEGSEVLRTAVLNPAVADADGVVQEPCTKRKCAKHYDWAKLQLDDTRFEMGENSEAMRALEREEKEIKERASLRAREFQAGGVGGEVEVHDPSLGPEIQTQQPTDEEILELAGDDDALSTKGDEEVPESEEKEEIDGMEGLEEHQHQSEQEPKQTNGEKSEQEQVEKPEQKDDEDEKPQLVQEQELEQKLEQKQKQKHREPEQTTDPEQQPELESEESASQEDAQMVDATS